MFQRVSAGKIHIEIAWRKDAFNKQHNNKFG